MYNLLHFLHSLNRWMVLGSLAYVIWRAALGYLGSRPFSKTDNALRHWSATIAHLQLILGLLLYIQLPLTSYFWSHFKESIGDMEIAFFGLWHILLMVVAIIIVTITSAISKRRPTDPQRFKTLLIGYTFALLIILVAIPWPFSPFAHRPYLKLL